eukprot:gene7881-16131_t
MSAGCFPLTTKRIVLHLDINKTLIISDHGINKDMDDILNGILCDNVWGSVPKVNKRRRKLTDWIVFSTQPTRSAPEDGLITFEEYMEHDMKVTGKKRQKLHYEFSELGNVGHICRPVFDQLKQSLIIPSNIHINTNNLPFLADGTYHILPSFFELIKYLHVNNYNFHIIFRTFGSDLSNIIQEYNEFCKGHHPLFLLPDGVIMNGENGSIDRRVKPPYGHLKLRRKSEHEDGVELSIERLHNQEVIDNNIDHTSHHELQYQVEVISGATAIFNEWSGWWESGVRAMAVSDDYCWWDTHDESEDSGKLLMIDCNDEDNNIIQMFFDDNIERDRAHIVDVRDIQTFKHLSFVEVQDRYLRRVEPYLAITDKNYFINEVEDMLKSRLKIESSSISEK